MDTYGFGRLLSHPLRVRIVELMGDGEVWTPNGLAEALGEPLGNTSYHLRWLCTIGAIELVGVKPRRGAVQHFYRRSPVDVPALRHDLERMLAAMGG